MSIPDLSKVTKEVVIVGGGSAGLTAAKLASSTLGNPQVLLIESASLGGDCTWSGCIPSKSILSAAKSAHAARTLGLLEGKVNWKQIQDTMKRKRREIYEKDDSVDALNKLGIEVLEGMAEMVSANSLRVNLSNRSSLVEVVATKGIIVCTGASPRIPESIKVSEEVSSSIFMTYEDLWDGLQEIPNRMTVVGGGPVGCEIAQAFARFGSKVTMIVKDRLLPREESAASELLEEIFIKEGILIVRGDVTEIAATSESSHRAIFNRTDDRTKTKKDHVEGDIVVLAVGRTPRTQGMGLENVGIELNENGGIKVDSRLETTVRGIFAAGDCTGDRQFTHYAGFQGAIAARNILLPLSDKGVLADVPATTYTSPEVASIGLSEKSAKAKLGSHLVQVAEKRLSDVDRAVCDDETDGLIKIVFEKRSGRILGATVVAPCAGEMISEIAVAMKAGMTFPALTNVMHPYPSYAIALQLLAADEYYVRTMRYKPIYDCLKKLGL